jgi:hypothetical protein
MIESNFLFVLLDNICKSISILYHLTSTKIKKILLKKILMNSELNFNYRRKKFCF